MRKALARLLSAALLLNSLSPAQAASYKSAQTSGPAKALPATVIPAASVLPGAAASAAKAAKAEAAASLPQLRGVEAIGASLKDVKAGAGSVKESAALPFENGLAARPEGALTLGSFGAMPALERAGAPALAARGSIPAPRPLTLVERARSYAPAALVATAVAAAAWTSQALGFDAAASAPLLMAGTMFVPAPGSNEQKLLAALRASREPGDAMDWHDVLEAGEQVGLDEKGTNAAYFALVKGGSMAHSDFGLHVLLDPFETPKDESLKAPWRSAMDAVELWHKPALDSKFAALSRFNAALQAFNEKNDNSAQRRQLAMLDAIAVHGVIKRVMADLRDEASKDSNAAQDYLALSPEDRSIDAVMSDPDSYAVLSKLLARLKPGGDRDAALGLELVRHHVAKNSPVGPARVARSIIAYMTHQVNTAILLDEEAQGRFAEMLEVHPDAVAEAIKAMTNEDWAMRTASPAAFMGFTTRARLELPNLAPELRPVFATATRAIKEANKPGAAGPAAALVLAEQASKDYADFLAKKELPRQTVFGELRDAAAMLLTYEVLRELTPNVSPDGADHAAARRMLNWLQNAPGAGRSALELAPAVADTLAGLIDRYAPHGAALAEKPEALRKAMPLLRAFHGLQPVAVAAEDSKKKPGTALTVVPGKSVVAANDGGFTILPNDETTAALYKYGVNVTGQAMRGELKPMIGREDKLEQMMQILIRHDKNAPLVVGEAGVGKTALVEGLAQRIVSGDVPDELKGRNIIKLSLKALMAGTKYRGDVEERLEAVLNAARAHKGKVSIFIDEIHLMLNLGKASDGGIGVSDAVLEDLGRGTISMIGATTLDAYRKIRKDQALDRRFDGVLLDPASVADTVLYLKGRRADYEKHYGVLIPDDVLEEAARAASEHIRDKYLPDSAFDLVDLAGAAVKMGNYKAKKSGAQAKLSVEPMDVLREVAKKRKVPVERMTMDQRKRLEGLEGRLNARVIGQPHAVQAMADAVTLERMGNKDPNAPPEGFLFLGPTGVGKTELAKAVAFEEFDDENAVLRFDMSEYMEKHTVSRLIGAPPGYVGHDGPGLLTEPIRNRPHQVILLDEVDKAHPDVLKVLLQILDHGELTDAQGNKVDFRKTRIIMTANYAGQHTTTAKREIGFTSKEPTQETVGASYLENARANLPPELLGRVGLENVITFNEHTKATLELIAGLKLTKLNTLLVRKKMKVEFSERALASLVAEANLPENRALGARPIVYAVEKRMTKALSRAEVKGDVGPGDAVVADYTVEAGWTFSKAK